MLIKKANEYNQFTDKSFLDFTSEAYQLLIDFDFIKIEDP